MADVIKKENGAEAGPSLRSSATLRMGTAPMLGLIFRMSLPSMFSMFVHACYNVVDSVYVSRLGQAALSAVSLIFPVQLLDVAVGIGTSIGLTSLISRRLGEKRLEDAQLSANHGMLLCLLHWIAFLLFGIFGSLPFCRAFSSNPELIYPAASYCMICCVGSFFPMTASSLEKIMQAQGNMIAPMWSMLSGAITNIILDPLFIFGDFTVLGIEIHGLGLGVDGAACATGSGEFVAFIVSLTFIMVKDLPVKIEFRLFKVRGRIIRDIYAVGVPSMVMQAIGSLTTLLLNAILISFSETAVAVYGVYFKIQSFVFMPVFGMNHGLLPIMGYNFGARNKKRLLLALRYGITIAFCVMTTGTVLFNLFGTEIMGFFNAEGEMLSQGVVALRVISWCFPMAAISIIFGTLFQATAHGMRTLVTAVLRQIVLIVPLGFVFSKLLGLGVVGVWYAYPIAEFAALVLSVLLFIGVYRNDIANM